jgi:hypothetical protein
MVATPRDRLGEPPRQQADDEQDKNDERQAMPPNAAALREGLSLSKTSLRPADPPSPAGPAGQSCTRRRDDQWIRLRRSCAGSSASQG